LGRGLIPLRLDWKSTAFRSLSRPDPFVRKKAHPLCSLAAYAKRILLSLS
jgi:hypothetical protein